MLAKPKNTGTWGMDTTLISQGSDRFNFGDRKLSKENHKSNITYTKYRT